MAEAYHEGELQLQEKFGELKGAERAGRVISNSIIPGAVVFLENQASAIVSSMDDAGAIWTSILIGKPGFVTVPELTQVGFNSDMILSPETDIFFDNIKENQNIGSLFIELGSRRRYRINGKIKSEGSHIALAIEEAYPNCPKYIQRRLLHVSTENEASIAQSAQGEKLTKDQKDWILGSDTFFVGTQGKDGRLDASHRGGNPGFVEILANGTLKIPDYVGNKMYNTLGNILQNNKAGLLFMDYQNKRTLQLTGHAKLLLDQEGEEDQQKTTGTGRFWIFEPSKWIQTDNHHNVDWEFLDASPLNPIV